MVLVLMLTGYLAVMQVERGQAPLPDLQMLQQALNKLRAEYRSASDWLLRDNPPVPCYQARRHKLHASLPNMRSGLL